MASRAFLLVHGKACGPENEESKLWELHDWLKGHGTVVFNEYTWGKTRRYNETLEKGLDEIMFDYEHLLANHLHVYVIGHSLGGNALIQLAHKGLHFPDGLILLNPAHNIGTPKIINTCNWSVEKARRLIEEGKAQEPTDFVDVHLNDVEVCYGTPEGYLSFFDPTGLCNMYNYNPEKLVHQHFLWLHSQGDPTQRAFPGVWSNVSCNSKSSRNTSPTEYHGPDPEVHFPRLEAFWLQNESENNF
jgi:hypothetical protein